MLQHEALRCAALARRRDFAVRHNEAMQRNAAAGVTAKPNQPRHSQQSIKGIYTGERCGSEQARRENDECRSRRTA
jgi:hypothetical protein